MDATDSKIFKGKTTITINDWQSLVVEADGEGTVQITSNLKMNSTGDNEFDRHEGIPEFNAAIDGLESMLCALIGEGLIDPNSATLPNAIQTALDAIDNNL